MLALRNETYQHFTTLYAFLSCDAVNSQECGSQSHNPLVAGEENSALRHNMSSNMINGSQISGELSS